MNTLLLNSILSDDDKEVQALKTCPPKSLVEWKETKKMDDSSSSIEVETRQKCKVEIPDLQPETDSKERDLMAWELLNNKLKNDSQIWAFFKKVPSYIDNLNLLYGPVNIL